MYPDVRIDPNPDGTHTASITEVMNRDRETFTGTYDDCREWLKEKEPEMLSRHPSEEPQDGLPSETA